jgi:hypothetical protein
LEAVELSLHGGHRLLRILKATRAAVIVVERLAKRLRGPVHACYHKMACSHGRELGTRQLGPERFQEAGVQSRGLRVIVPEAVRDKHGVGGGDGIRAVDKRVERLAGLQLALSVECQRKEVEVFDGLHAVLEIVIGL